MPAPTTPTLISTRLTQYLAMKNNLVYEWWKDPSAVIQKILHVFELPFGEIQQQLEFMPAMRSISQAWDFALEMVASNVGLTRRNGESDVWLRERTRFAVFLQHITGNSDDVQKALSWYIGIKKQDLNWATSIQPKVTVYQNKIPFWPYNTVDGIGKNVPAFMLVTFPWSIVDQWQGDSWPFIGDSSGSFPFQAVSQSSSVVYGNHLLLDLVNLSDILVMSGIKLLLWGLGNTFIGNTADGFPFQAIAGQDSQLSGPVDIKGFDNVFDHATEPNGCLTLVNTTEFPNVFRDVPSEDIFDNDSGKRSFRYGIGAITGGVTWP